MDIKSPVAEARNEYLYSAGGQKLKVVQKWNPNYTTTPVIGSGINVSSLTMSTTTDYVGNIIYENNTLKRILVDGGYNEGGNYYFYINDHLGNNRIVANAAASVVQSTQYYPFGMPFADATGASVQPYKYNNKELDGRNGLNWYDYSARYLALDFPVMPMVDPHAESYYSWSPYVYCYNNPIKFIDPDGRDPDDGFFGFLSNLSDKIERFLGINQPSNLKGADRARQDLANLKAGQQRAEQLAAVVNTTGEMLSYGFPLSNTAKVMAKSTRGVETTVGEKVFAGLEVVGLAASFVGAGLEGTTKIASTVAGKADDVTTVGRWMSKTEYATMSKTNQMIEGAGGKTSVAIGGADAFKGAAKGSVYVEFGVPTNSLVQGGQSNWFSVIGPNANRVMQATVQKQGGQLINEIQIKNLSPILKTK